MGPIMPAPTTLRDSSALIAAGFALEAARPALDRVGERYAVAIPPALAALIEHADDPIGRQFIPDPAELQTAPHEHPDPIGDDALSPVSGIVHRYSGPRAAEAAAGLPGLLPLLLPPRARRTRWRAADRGRSWTPPTPGCAPARPFAR